MIYMSKDETKSHRQYLVDRIAQLDRKASNLNVSFMEKCEAKKCIKELELALNHLDTVIKPQLEAEMIPESPNYKPNPNNPNFGRNPYNVALEKSMHILGLNKEK